MRCPNPVTLRKKFPLIFKAGNSPYTLEIPLSFINQWAVCFVCGYPHSEWTIHHSPWGFPSRAGVFPNRPVDVPSRSVDGPSRSGRTFTRSGELPGPALPALVSNGNSNLLMAHGSPHRSARIG